MKTFSVIFIAVFSSATIAQTSGDNRRTYHWYFGNGAGLDFSSGAPVAVTDGAMTAEEGCASISDTCGNLLFYTDGDTVWNRNHLVMPNGTGLMGCYSSTQSSLIVPQPENDSIYYIFLTDCGENAGANGLRYSIVNINLDGGLGDVTDKNFPMYSPTLEKLASTYHNNGTDLWILSVNRYPSGPPPDTTYQYHAHLLSSTGISPFPVISGSSMSPHKIDDGYMRFSHDGNRLANAWHAGTCYFCDTLEILDFDNTTGVLSNPFTLVADSANWGYGLVFSPDDSKIYHTTTNLFNWPEVYYKVFQFDLTGGDSASIAATKTLIHLCDSTNPLYTEYLSMQTGPDKRIYVAKMNNFGGEFYPDSIDVIFDPNLSGLACNYTVDGVSLGIGNGSQAGLPNFVDSYFQSPWSPVCSAEIPQNNLQEITIYPNPSSGAFQIDFSENLTVIIYNPPLQKIGEQILDKENSPYYFDLSDQPSGLYFIHFSTQNNSATKKFYLSK